jgi:hypothetical protein
MTWGMPGKYNKDFKTRKDILKEVFIMVDHNVLGGKGGR